MANRFFGRIFNTLVKEPVLLFGRVTFGAAGAPTLDAVNSKGIKSIVRNSAGNYTVTLGGGGVSGTGFDPYPRLFDVDIMYLNATFPAAPQNYVVSEQVKNSAAPQFVLQFAAGGVATDPGNGEEVRFAVTLTNSTAQ